MRIGIDFDNTIVSYDALFYRVASERTVLPASVPVNKLAVRDHFRRAGQEAVWTELQGYVYGPRMNDALIFDGVLDFCRRALAAGHQLFIISHRTKHPFLGEQHDLHGAARAWIERHLLIDGQSLLPHADIFFEVTKSDKIARIAQCRCEAFIDDLPEILTAPDFPKDTARLLFDPDMHHTDVSAAGLQSFRHWRDLNEHLNA